MQMDFRMVGRWAVLAAFGVSTGLMLPARALAQARALPDFTDLVEQVGPSVVNIRTLEKVPSRARPGNGSR